MGWQSRWLSLNRTAIGGRAFATLVIAVALSALSGIFFDADEPDVFAAVKLKGRLTFNDLQLTNCYYRNQFFDKNVRAAFALFDSTGSVQIDPPSGAPYLIGRFARYGATPADSG